ESVVDWARSNNLVTTCADTNSEFNYFDADWKKARLVVFGSEAHGLDRFERDLMEETISIPMANGVESLNIAVSCGIIVFEAIRQT
ncbi:MAG: RNA methyltransferase, partial [Pyrinomonadaceae bacterium]|nr:RNA methyltransferase [Pyrinomonadaceae bacterium]